MLLERFILFLAIAGLLFAGYALLRRWQVSHAARIATDDPLLSSLRPDIPAILYFTTPACAPCKTQQRPALHKLLADLGESVQVIEVDAFEQPDAANRWGVLSVPTTFILDRQGRPREVNYGVAGAEKLKQQLQRI